MSSGSARIRILAVDDHPLVRDGIAGLVGVQPDMTLVAEAANGRDAIQQFRAHRPDVTLMDIQMPEMNGLDALIAIRTEFPDAKVIVLTTYEGDVHILRALKAGAQGYLLKNTLHVGITAIDPGSPCRKEESVARGLVSGRRACKRSDTHASRSRCVASHRSRQREQADRGSARHYGRDRQGTSQEHSRETGCQRPGARGDHRPQERNHRAVDPKESHPPPRRGLRAGPP